jgi:transposase
METLSKDALLVAPRQDLIDTIVSLRAINDQLRSRLQELEFSMEWFKKQIYGTKSERFIPCNMQQTLNLGVQPVELKIAQRTIAAHTRTTTTPVEGHGRGVMPTHLPFVDIVIEPEQDIAGMVKIGEEVTWEYDCEPKSLFVKRYIRPKYVHPENENAGVTIGVLPDRPVDKGNMGPGLLANIVLDKYLYHTPLECQSRKISAEYNVRFAESVLCDAVRNVSFWIEPIYKIMAADIVTATYLQADETSIKVLWHELKGKAHTGWYWGYHDPLRKITVFDFKMSRGREGPNEFLKNFSGTLQTDDYAGYVDVRARPDILWAACMAHVRRKFNDCLNYDMQRATYALECIKPWFNLESQAVDDKLGHAARLAMRQELIKPSMEQFSVWLKNEVIKILPKSPMSGAISYALNQWVGFTPFLTDGRIELSTNNNENNMRPIAVGRKNYLFKGSPEAAQRGAMIYSVLATAQKHGLDIWKYLRDLLTYLPRLKDSKQAVDFVPYNWNSAQSKYLPKE